MLAVSAGISDLASVGLASADLGSGDFSGGFSTTAAFSEADRSSSVRSDMPLAFTPASGRLLTSEDFSTGLPSVAAFTSVLASALEGSAVDTAAATGASAAGLALM